MLASSMLFGRRALAGAAALGLLAVILLLSGPARAQTIEVRVEERSATADPGTNVALGSTAVPTELRGRTCRASVTVTNGDSTHTGNRLVVSTGSSNLVVDGIEETPGSVTTTGGTLTLGSSLDVSVVLGSTGATSLGMVVTCEPAAATTTTTGRPNTTTTVGPGPVTTPKEKEHIPAACTPNPVERGSEVTVSGGRTDGFGFRGGSPFDVRNGRDGPALETGTVEANGLFEVTFVIDLEPGDYVFEIESRGAKALARCTVDPGTEPPLPVPRIMVEPTSGPYCSPVTITGFDFGQGDRVSAEIGHAPLGDPVIVDASGQFTLTALVPDIDPAPFPISALRSTEPEAESVRFDIVEGGPAITVVPASGTVDAPIEISGSGFPPGDTVEITIGGAPFPGPVEVDDAGAFSVAATVPAIEEDTYQVDVAGRCAVAPATNFTVGPGITPTIAVAPARGEAGSEATVSGEDYVEGELVDITFKGLEFASGVEVDEDGRFEVTGTVPEIDPEVVQVAGSRGRAPEAAEVSFEVVGNGCWKILWFCWWWWILILLLLLLLLWFLLWLWCQRRYPFRPGQEIRGSGWIMCEGECDCRYRGGRCVSDGGACPDGCSCELFRRKVWRSGGCWERVPERQERFTWCYRCACARPIEAASTAEIEKEAP